ncbi:MAG: DUF6493 family protein [Pseudomonadota bacterium]
MTEDDALELAQSTSAKSALARFAAVDEATRRKAAKPVLTLWKAHWQARFSTSAKAPKPPKIRDMDALRIALFATATPSELKPYGFHVLPEEIALTDVIAAMKPSWIDRFVANMVEDWPHLVQRVAPVWRAGLCARPEGDSLILGYFSHISGVPLSQDEAAFLTHDIWRFFEVEGSGEFSLAAVDKYSPAEAQWGTVIVKLSVEGKLDRNRLLDASLDALERDFSQFRAGWYSRLHTALEPTLEEQAARTTRYLHLLASPIPPTVSFALKAVKALDKAGKMPTDALLGGISPALQARQKSTVTTALQLLAGAAKRAPDRAAEIARLAATALISETPDVQSKALDLVDRLGAAHDPEVTATLAAHLGAVAPSLQPRLAAMVGETAPETGPVENPPEAAAPLSPVLPVESMDAAISLFLEVLESCRDPIAVERAVDGIARFGAEACAAGDKLSPVAKRSNQLLDRPGDVELKLVLAATGAAWADGSTIAETLSQRFPPDTHRSIAKDNTAQIFVERTEDVLTWVREGRSQPLLSLPSDDTGQVAATDLVDRAETCLATDGTLPHRDLALALTRLAPAGREAALARIGTGSEAERAIAFALGGDVTPDEDPALWVAAWAAAMPDTSNKGIVRLVRASMAGAGTPAQLTLRAERQENPPYAWCVAGVDVIPKPVPGNARFASSVFHLPAFNRYLSASPCGSTFEDIAWASILWPARMEPFFSCAIPAMDTDQKLTDHHCRAYLEPLFRPTMSCGPMACGMLAFYLASADPSVTSLAVDAIATLVGQGRLCAEDLADPVWQFAALGALPFGRWIRAFRDIAAISPVHAGFVRHLMAGVLRFGGEEVPREMGAYLELLFELHCAAGTRLDTPAAVACLKRLPGGGKTRTFAKKLIALAEAG